ncbi:MAG: YfaZ family outer membrane protein [Spongiibacteraceae bacterium]
MKSSILAVFILSLFTSMAQAGGLGFRFGDDTFGVSVAGDLSDESSVQLDWTHHEDGADLVSLGAFATGSRGAVQGRVGAKAIFLEGDDSGFDGGALAFGGDFSIPLNDIVRGFAGAYYAPSTTSFSDVDGYLDYSTGIEFLIFQNSALQVGYASTEFDTETNRTIEFEDGFFLRMQLRL